MTGAYDAITIGSGLGGLTAAALYARAGHRVLVLERNAEFGGAATTYRHGRLTIEGSLQQTADLWAPLDPKARILRALGILDDLEFVPVGAFYEVRGRLFDPPFVLPHGFDAAEAALADRFPLHRSAFRRFFQRLRAVQEAMSVVGEQHDSLWWFLHAPALPLKLWPLLRDVRLGLAEVFEQLFGDDEAPQARAGRQPRLLRGRSRPAVVGVLRARAGRLSGQRRHLHPGRLRGAQPQPGRRGGGRRRRCTRGPHGDRDHARRRRPRRRLSPIPHPMVATASWTALRSSSATPPRPSSPRRYHPRRGRQFAARYQGRRSSISLFSIALGLNRPARELGLTHYSTMLLPEWMDSLADYARCADILADPPGPACRRWASSTTAPSTAG